MMSPQPLILAAGLGLALSGPALVGADNPSPDQLLNEATFADSEDSTQVREEKSVERKDQSGDAKTGDAAATGASGPPETPADPESGHRAHTGRK